MNSPSVQKLINAARQAHSPVSKHLDTAPVGFAARVVGKARHLQKPTAPATLDILERLGWCGAATSAAICLVAFTLHTRQTAPNPFEILMEAPAQTIPADLP
jgi:hypothetical protein